MTEWNDVKVGELYKRVDESSVALVIGFEPHAGSDRVAWVTLLEGGQLRRVMTMGYAYGPDTVSFGYAGLYKAVAV